MRMWMIEPELLCRKHLLGEHGEIHKFLPSFRKGYRVGGRFDPIVQIQFQGYLKRHDDLASEMLTRGYSHNSPLLDIPDFRSIYPEYWDKKVNTLESLRELKLRCSECVVDF